MTRTRAINLLEFQKSRIWNPLITRQEWLAGVIPVIINIFPKTAAVKVSLLEKLNEDPNFYEDLPSNEKKKLRKKKAEKYLQNFIEEIEFLGVEDRRIETGVLLRNYTFWIIIICAGLAGFYGGEIFREENETVLERLNDLEKKNHFYKNKIEALELQLSEKIKLS
ncbi:hypothetical protein RM553_00315 [Zunongwangia sp. F363]|uniref:Uncharacterized protein n=1 Tax=Autumnicola tepida TaxID=3075595 RepID=A0ABU3C561_9FLAO|nr:hypothetical protein [Zunongwangia sp. F363]MDT0641260.1 hypothetical protein [Zunongwangia sp. F363]